MSAQVCFSCASGNIHCSPCWFSCDSCASVMSKTAVSYLQHRSIFRNNSCFQKGLLRQYDSNILSLQKSPDYRQEMMRRASVGNTDVGAIGENIKGPKMKDRGLALPKSSSTHSFVFLYLRYRHPRNKTTGPRRREEGVVWIYMMVFMPAQLLCCFTLQRVL